MDMLDLYLKFKIFGDFIIPLVFLLIFALTYLIIVIKFKLDKKFKKNCFECDYYKLYDVSSVGTCRFKCSKLNRIDRHDMNNRYNLIRCKDFIKGEKDNG